MGVVEAHHTRHEHACVGVAWVCVCVGVGVCVALCKKVGA